MANLREYFFKELEGLGTQTELTITTNSGETVVVVEKVNFDILAGVNFVSYFFPASTFKLHFAIYLLEDPFAALKRSTESVGIKFGNSVSDREGTWVHDQPFSGRVHIYVDDFVDESSKAELKEYGLSRGLRVNLRDRAHSDFQTEHETPWAFISHDSRDKDEVARPLAEKLSSMLCPVWYDEYSIGVGDSLRETIDRGIRDAKKCIVVLSPNFLNDSGWTKQEFNGAMGKHVASGGETILPIWHGVSREEVFEYSPMLAGIMSLPSTLGIDEMARQLYRKLGPQ
jgi:hypothetical protein